MKSLSLLIKGPARRKVRLAEERWAGNCGVAQIGRVQLLGNHLILLCECLLTQTTAIYTHAETHTDTHTQPQPERE